MEESREYWPCPLPLLYDMPFLPLVCDMRGMESDDKHLPVYSPGIHAANKCMASAFFPFDYIPPTAHFHVSHRHSYGR